MHWHKDTEVWFWNTTIEGLAPEHVSHSAVPLWLLLQADAVNKTQCSETTLTLPNVVEQQTTGSLSELWNLQPIYHYEYE